MRKKGGLPLAGKVETKPARYVSLSQHQYQETTGESAILLKDFKSKCIDRMDCT